MVSPAHSTELASSPWFFLGAIPPWSIIPLYCISVLMRPAKFCQTKLFITKLQENVMNLSPTTFYSMFMCSFTSSITMCPITFLCSYVPDGLVELLLLCIGGSLCCDPTAIFDGHSAGTGFHPPDSDCSVHSGLGKYS